MTRYEFTVKFLTLIVKKIPQWIPEEDTEDEMLDIMMDRILEHKTLIREVLSKGD